MEQISKENESGKSNRIYRKNKKSTKGSRSSVKKGTEEYEETNK